MCSTTKLLRFIIDKFLSFFLRVDLIFVSSSVFFYMIFEISNCFYLLIVFYRFISDFNTFRSMTYLSSLTNEEFLYGDANSGKFDF